MLTYYTRKESHVQIAVSGEHTRLACRLESLAVASRPLQRRLVERNLIPASQVRIQAAYDVLTDGGRVLVLRCRAPSWLRGRDV